LDVFQSGDVLILIVKLTASLRHLVYHTVSAVRGPTNTLILFCTWH